MKNWLLALFMLFGAVALSQQSKTIKDPAEYNAYIAALNTQDPAAKAAAMEAFVQQYPHSVMLEDALEQSMAGYQQAGNTQKVLEKARQILALDAGHIRALAIITYVDRSIATAGKADSPPALKEACASAQTGLQHLPTWPKPEGTSDADFGKLKEQMAEIFNGAAGFCALNSKDYMGARGYYLKAIEHDPNDLQNTYQLAISYLETDPIDLQGFWYGAKAINLAGNNTTAVNAIAPYIKAKYKKYHGNTDGWSQFAAATTSQTAPPSHEELAKLITPAPTPCDFAVQAVKDNKPEDLSFSDKEFILGKANCSPANKDAADKVWQSIQVMEKNGEARLQIPVKVIAVSTDSIDCAISDDNQAAGKADVHVMMEKPMARPPAVGSTVNIVGVITNYTPDPFMFTMEKGALPASK